MESPSSKTSSSRSQKWRLAHLSGVLALTMMSSALLVPMLSVLSAPLRAEFQISRSQLGWAMTVSSASAALASYLMGVMTDRFGGRSVIQAMFWMSAIVILLVSRAPSYEFLIFVAVLAGLPHAAGNPAANSLILNEVSAVQRGTAMGIKQSGVQFAFMFTGLALPPLVGAFGWRLAVIACLILPIFGLVSARSLPKVEIGARRPTIPRVGLPNSTYILSGYAVFMGFSNGAIIAFIPLFAVDSFDVGLTEAGAMVSVFGFVGIPARILWARRSGKAGSFSADLQWLAAGALAAAAALSAAPVFGKWLMWIAVVGSALTIAAWSAVAHLMSVSTVTLGQAGRAGGTLTVGFLVGYAIGPVAFGSLVDATGSYASGWSLMVGASAFAFALARRIVLTGAGGLGSR